MLHVIFLVVSIIFCTSEGDIWNKNKINCMRSDGIRSVRNKFSLRSLAREFIVFKYDILYINYSKVIIIDVAPVAPCWQ